MINIAKKFLNYGLSPLPIRAGTKSPAVQTWSKELLLTPDQAEKMFVGIDSIAVITGTISGNLECIDFDNHLNNAMSVFGEFIAYKPIADIIRKYDLPYESTQSGGYHLFYRCKAVTGSLKLAYMTDAQSKKVTVIETRGTGGYVIVAPSPKYSLLRGSFDNIKEITEEEREIIISYCRSCNEITNPAQLSHNEFPINDMKPGEIYNESCPTSEIASLLKHNGWKSSDNVYFTRPGKETGISATLGKMKQYGFPLFHVFSSNADPFEGDKAYTPFSVFSLLGHGGDFSSAAKELYDRGFGKKATALDRKISPNVLIGEDTPIPEREKKKTPMILEMQEFINSVWDLRYDTVLNSVDWKLRGLVEWETCNENSLLMELLRAGFKVGKDMVSSLLGSDFVPRYDPFKSYFENCPRWDGVDEFSELCKYIDVDDPEFFRDMLEKQFVRTIKCAIEPGFYNRFAFILQSRQQEQGKSMFIRYLNPFGDKYYTDEQLKDDKDSLIALSENFIYNLEEIDDMKKVGVGKLKAVLAKRMVNVRHPYGKQKVNSPRRCSFYGSTNLDEFLTDDVNTRWLVFKVNEIRHESMFKNVNIDALWSQAWALYNDSSYQWDLTEKEKQHREKNNLRHKQSNIEDDIIAELFEYGNDREVLSIPQVIKRIRDSVGAGIKVNLDASHIYDVLVGMGFQSCEKIAMGRVLKYFKIKNRYKSVYEED